MKDPFRKLLIRRVKLDEEDFKFIAELRDNYNLETLNFLAKRLPLRTSHVLDNYGILVGSPSQLKLFLVLVAVIQVALVPSPF